MKEVKEFERDRRLIKMLDEWKREGKRIIIFARAVFHQQYAAQVLSLICKANITGNAHDRL